MCARTKKSFQYIRHLIQGTFTLITNANIKGFANGTIFRGKTKYFCVPGLNCYSCPGAIASCPVGALQSVLNRRKKSIALYVPGILILFGTIFARFICGFLCAFGFLQDLLFKIPTPKIKIPQKIDKPLRLLKYAVLIFMCILLPLLYRNRLGSALPFFCEFLCPQGTLEGGIPLLLKNKTLQKAIGLLFYWKFIIMLFIVVEAIFIYRPFCKYLCPLGAFYSLFNRISFYRLHVDKNKCTDCGTCAKTCKMAVNPLKNINSTECIRCGECIANCPSDAISREKIFIRCKPRL